MTKKSDYRKFLWKKTKVRSGLELRVKEQLEQKGIRFGYEDTKLKYRKLSCQHCGECVKWGTYTPDFTIRNDRHTFFIESKGRFLSSDRTKILNVLRDNPTIDLRILFQRDHVLRKGSTTRYSDWAEKHGITYSVGEEVPASWL